MGICSWIVVNWFGSKLIAWQATGTDFNPVAPARVLDTRPGQSPNALRNVPKTPIGPGNTLEVQLSNLPGNLTPTTGISAAAINVTTTGSTERGFITIYPCATQPGVSTLNFTAGQTIANAAITPLSPTGTICIASNVTTNVIIDINGWFATGLVT